MSFGFSHTNTLDRTPRERESPDTHESHPFSTPNFKSSIYTLVPCAAHDALQHAPRAFSSRDSLKLGLFNDSENSSNSPLRKKRVVPSRRCEGEDGDVWRRSRTAVALAALALGHAAMMAYTDSNSIKVKFRILNFEREWSSTLSFSRERERERLWTISRFARTRRSARLSGPLFHSFEMF